MANLWTKFKELLPSDKQQIGVVAAVLSDGSRRITMPAGADVRITGGSSSVGQSVLFVRDEYIMDVPTLATTSQTV